MLVEEMMNVGLNEIKQTSPIHAVIHEKLLNLFKTYCIVGGMPEALVTWVESQSYLAV